MNVYVPKICDQASVFAVLGQVVNEDGECYSDHYYFDAKAVSVIDPFSLVILNNLFAWLERKGHKLRIDAPTVDLDSSLSYLGYVHEEGVYPFNDAIRVHEGMIPLAHIPIEKSSSWVLTTFNRWLAEVLGVSTLSLFRHMQFVRLLFRYATHFGKSEGVILHASMGKELQNVRIVIAHYGQGIPDLARNSWSSFANPAVEIAKATEGSFQETGPSKDGHSLMFLIDDVIVENGGLVSIYSGFGYMKAARNQWGITQKLGLNNAYLPGTVFDITFRLDVTGLLTRINEPGNVEFSIQRSAA